MQRLPNGRLQLSPSDLTRFHESPFASWCHRRRLDDPSLQPDEDPAAAVFQKYGHAHERRLLARLRDELGLEVVEIAEGEGAERATREALAREPDVLYQARLVAAPFAGVADFLVHPRVAAWARGEAPGPEPGITGAYEVWDAKLARSVKPTHPIQLCAYADMLEQMGGEAARPEWLVVALGSGSFERLRRDEYFDYYALLRARFLEWIDEFDPSPQGRPLPEPGQEHREWASHAEAVLEEVDHVSRVATLRRDQAKKLADAGIITLTGLAKTRLGRIPGLQDATFAKLREQARLQRASPQDEPPRYRVLSADEVAAGKGLASLPPASPGDVYFDLEGFPLHEGSLEYLWGVAYAAPEDPDELARELEAGARLVGEAGGAAAAEKGSRPQRTAIPRVLYRAWWAHGSDEEQQVFEAFLDWLAARRERHPDLHVYHYAPYERTVLTRIQSRVGTREAALDSLLREHVLVDLYAVVRHGLRVGEPRYGIKNIERLYRGARQGAVSDAMASVVAYEEWLESGEPRDPARSERLEAIRRYNEDDCVSTLELAEWLRVRQRETGIAWMPPAPVPRDPKKAREREETRAAQRDLAHLVREQAGPEPPAEAGPAAHTDWRVGQLLAQLIDFHHREARPLFWQLHERADASEEERSEAADCLAGLERSERPVFSIKQSQGYEYRFDPQQDTRVRVGTAYRLAQARTLAVEVESIDPGEGRVVLKVTSGALAKVGLDALPQRCCLVAFDHRGTRDLEKAIAAIAAAWADDRRLPPALRDLLERRAPRWTSAHCATAAPAADTDSAGSSSPPGDAPLRRGDESCEEALHRLVRQLDDSCLVVQGPPGSGKTTLGARVIAGLASEGRTVGISANSHKVIQHLMSACGREARAAGRTVRLVKVGGQSEEEQSVPGEEGTALRCQSRDAASHASPGTILGGTAWCFARTDMIGRLDVLVVDEAGQVSLANLVAMARCAKSLVLLGDPAQLAQPLRGLHPGDSGRSALEYALAESGGLVDERKGLFLADTWRLHPALCDFVSRQFYAGRLLPARGNEQRVLLPRPDLDPGASLLGDIGAGLHFLAVEHEGNRQASDEEVDVIRRLVRELVGATVRGLRGVPGRADEPDRVLGASDILVVAPYNLQVDRLRRALPAAVEVGTVDRFQGKEAPVVVLSLCASTPELAPRGLGFLLSRNRVNVGVSRGQTLAVVVGSPGLAAGGSRNAADLRSSALLAGLLRRAVLRPRKEERS